MDGLRLAAHFRLLPLVGRANVRHQHSAICPCMNTAWLDALHDAKQQILPIGGTVHNAVVVQSCYCSTATRRTTLQLRVRWELQELLMLLHQPLYRHLHLQHSHTDSKPEVSTWLAGRRQRTGVGTHQGAHHPPGSRAHTDVAEWPARLLPPTLCLQSCPRINAVLAIAESPTCTCAAGLSPPTTLLSSVAVQRPPY